jgi:hypothetical protein
MFSNAFAYTLSSSDKAKLNKFRNAITNIKGVNDAMYVGDGIMQVYVNNSFYSMASSQQTSLAKTLHSKWKKIDGTGLPVYINLISSSGDILISYPSLW